jgi:DNA-binding XRE family transcriptional regulator
MSSVSRWRDSGHLERTVAMAGGQEAFDAAVAAMLDDARGWRLAEMRKRRGMTQEQVAVRMGVSVARVSQIERGDVSTQDVLNRYVSALGGTSQAHRRLRRRAAQDRLNGRPRTFPGPAPPASATRRSCRVPIATPHPHVMRHTFVTASFDARWTCATSRSRSATPTRARRELAVPARHHPRARHPAATRRHARHRATREPGRVIRGQNQRDTVNQDR